MFQPKPNEELLIDGIAYRIAEHPVAVGMPYGQEGRAGIVYQVIAGDTRRALKVFKSRYQAPALVTLAERLEGFARLPGLRVCKRNVITARRHIQLVREHPDLAYAVLMPWVEGPTWMEVLLDKAEFSPGQSLSLASALVEVLARMEERGLAHCDLSASNLMLPALGEGSVANAQFAVELVDVEQMYGEELRRPEFVPSGSAGYAHVTAPEGVWSIYADRFAGAMLISEILGWCDPRVREASWGESYLAPGELQRPSERYDLLRDVLRARWGEAVVRLLERAWESDTLGDCATCGHWLAALPDTVPPFTMPVKASASKGLGAEQQPEIRDGAGDFVNTPPIIPAQAQVLLDKARLLEAQGDLRDALGAYQEALLWLPAGSGMATEVALIISQLERELGIGDAPAYGAAGAGLQMETEDAELANLFSSGLAAYRQSEWAAAKELLAEVVRRQPGYRWEGQQAAALLASTDGHLAAQSLPPALPSIVVEPETAPHTQTASVVREVEQQIESVKRVKLAKAGWTRFALPALLLALLLVFGSLAILMAQSQLRPAEQFEPVSPVASDVVPSVSMTAAIVEASPSAKTDREETAQVQGTTQAQEGARQVTTTAQAIALVSDSATVQAQATSQAQMQALQATQIAATGSAEAAAIAVTPAQVEATLQALGTSLAQATTQAQAQIEQDTQATTQAQQVATNQALTEALGRANTQATAEAARQATTQAQQAAQGMQAATAQAVQTKQAQQGQQAQQATALSISQGATAQAVQAVQAAQATTQARQGATTQAQQVQQAQQATAQAVQAAQAAQATTQARQIATAQAAQAFTAQAVQTQQVQQAQQATALSISQGATAQAIQAVQAAGTATALSAAQAIAATTTAFAAIPAQWQVISSPNVGPGQNNLRAVAVVSANDVWAVGAYARNGPRQTLVEHWDGTRWSIIPSPNVGQLDNNFSGVAARAANDVWAVGHYIDPADLTFARTLIAHWDGTSWSLVQSPNGEVKSSFLRSVVALAAGEAWAVGYHNVEANGSGTGLPLLLRWNGSQWSMARSPQFDPSADTRLIAVDGSAPNDVWVVGTVGGLAKTLTMHWNGQEWSTVQSPNVGSVPNLLRAVEVIAVNNVWAVGYYGPPGSGQALFLHWDGATWKVFGGPAVGAASFAWDIDAVSANDVWAVGNYLKDGVTYTLVEHWNGQEWSTVQSPNVGFAGDYIFAVAAVSLKDVWGVGWHNSPEGANTLVLRYK